MQEMNRSSWQSRTRAASWGRWQRRVTVSPRDTPWLGCSDREGGGTGTGHSSQPCPCTPSCITLLSHAHAALPLSPFSPCPRTHVAVPCSLPPATNLQGTRSWSHTGPPTPVAPRPHCHSPRMRASAIGAMRLQQLGDNETAVGSGSGRKCNLISPWGQDDVVTPPHLAVSPVSGGTVGSSIGCTAAAQHHAAFILTDPFQ